MIIPNKYGKNLTPRYCCQYLGALFIYKLLVDTLFKAEKYLLHVLVKHIAAVNNIDGGFN